MTEIKKGSTYRHMSTLDTDMYVLRIKYFNDDLFKLKVIWVNRNNHIIYEETQLVTLYKKDLHKWQEVG